jgi:preprotein translocase subunit SecG
MGAAFGSGASGSLFGASGSSNFLSKSTAVAAAIFFAATLALAYFGTKPSRGAVSGGVMERAPAPRTGAAGNAGRTRPAARPPRRAGAGPACRQRSAPAPLPARPSKQFSRFRSASKSGSPCRLAGWCSIGGFSPPASPGGF